MTENNTQHELDKPRIGSGMRWVAIGAIVLAIAVILGAFGAHGLKGSLTVARMATYQTAVQYHFYHGLGIVLVGLLSMSLPNSKGIRWAATLLFAGIFLFSGSLYLLALFGVSWLGMITPLGGVAFIMGWLLLAATLFSQRDKASLG